jgi:hypothetical protein
LRDFPPGSRVSSERLKIVVYPVRVRVSPSSLAGLPQVDDLAAQTPQLVATKQVHAPRVIETGVRQFRTPRVSDTRRRRVDPLLAAMLRADR